MNGDAAGRRIAFVVPGGLGRVTGGNMYDLAVIDELRARGWAVDVVEPEASLEGADVVVVDSLSLPYGPPATDAPLVALLHQVPSEAEGHSEWRAGEAAVLGRSDLVVAVGAAVADSVKNVARTPPIVITPGWDGAAADGRSVDRDLVLSVANAHPGKGVPEAIAAFTLAGVGGSRLVLVGDLQRDRAEERRVREALRRCSLPVPRAGVVAPARLSELYARAAVLLTASRYEGWPIAVAEAMASGVPIVGFDIAGVRELLRDGHDGLLVPCAEVAALGRAMARVMGDAALAYRMGRAARHRARAWPTWEVTRRRFADELEQLAATRPVPRTRRTRNPTRTP